MIPDECALAVRDGVVCVVGGAGDVRPDRDEAGVYANDSSYLDEFAVRVTDRDAPESGESSGSGDPERDHQTREVPTDG